MKLLFLLISLSFLSICYSQSNYNIDKFEYLSPVPSSKYLSPSTNIIIRFGEALKNFNVNNSSLVNVDGYLSGHHEGSLYITKDSKTIVFNPYILFTNGEIVEVKLSSGLKTIADTKVDSLSFYFLISNKSSSSNILLGSVDFDQSLKVGNNFSRNIQSDIDTHLLIPSDFPKVYISNKNTKDGNYFLGINQNSSNYLSILDYNGIPLFYKRNLPRVYDFKIQPSGLITYFDASKNKFYGMDSLYQVVDSFYCRNGYWTNYHDLQVLPDGHSFVVSLDPQKIQMDTVKPGIYTNATVIGNVIQEVNEDNVVVWQWRTWDHYKITDADSSVVDFYQNVLEYTHINSIDVVDKDRIIFSVKDFNEITEVDRNTGKINWRFGGYNNQFKYSGGYTNFQLQHDARLTNGNNLTIFDNHNTEPDQNSRALIFSIDEQNKTANLIKIIPHKPDVASRNMGNIQATSKGNFVIGWGNTSGNSFYMSEADNNGATISNDSLVGKTFVYSYRAFKFPWKTRIITANKDSIIFNTYSKQSFAIDSIEIKNNSLASIDIDSVYFMKKYFKCSDVFPVHIPPEKKRYLHFTFESVNENAVTDTVYVVSSQNDIMASLPIIFIGKVITGIHDRNLNNPNYFSLSQNYPNPFNPNTIIKWQSPISGIQILKVYNVLGEEVKTLMNEFKPAGKYEVEFNASNFSSGIYFYKLSIGNYIQTKKMLYLK